MVTMVRVLGNMDDRSTLPWHRVVNVQGKIRSTMFTEHGHNLQAQLLLAKGVMVKNDKLISKPKLGKQALVPKSIIVVL